MRRLKSVPDYIVLAIGEIVYWTAAAFLAAVIVSALLSAFAIRLLVRIPLRAARRVTHKRVDVSKPN